MEEASRGRAWKRRPRSRVRGISASSTVGRAERSLERGVLEGSEVVEGAFASAAGQREGGESKRGCSSKRGIVSLV